MTSPRQALYKYTYESVPMFVDMYAKGALTKENIKNAMHVLDGYMSACKRPGWPLRGDAAQARLKLLWIAY